MKRYLFNLIFSIVLMLVCAQAYSQVKLADSGVTKFYEDGTRITYFEMDGFPNSVEVRDFMTKKVLEHPDVKRVAIYADGVTFMYEALQNIEPSIIVDMVNDVLVEYKFEIGNFTANEVYEGQEKSSSSSAVSHTDAPAKYSIIEEAPSGSPVDLPDVRRVERPAVQKTNGNENYNSKY